MTSFDDFITLFTTIGLIFLYAAIPAAVIVFILVRRVLRKRFSALTKGCAALYFCKTDTPEPTEITLSEEPFLFDTGVFENIKYGKIAASDEEVAAAAERAGISYLLDEKSCEHLTAAERRLVAAARAILTEPRKINVGRGLDGVDLLTVRGIELI
jgi:hypothetical protein